MNYAVIGWLDGSFYRREYASYGDARTFVEVLEAAGATDVDLFEMPSDLPF
jgi:hypothetical protein